MVNTLGMVSFKLKLDDIEKEVNADVVPDHVQNVPLIIGQPWTELSDLVAVKDNEILNVITKQPDIFNIEIEQDNNSKIALKTAKDVLIPSNNLVNVEVKMADATYEGDLYVKACLRYPGGQMLCIPRTIIAVQDGGGMFLPVINLSTGDLKLASKQVLVRANRCYPEQSASD